MIVQQPSAKSGRRLACRAREDFTGILNVAVPLGVAAIAQ